MLLGIAPHGQQPYGTSSEVVSGVLVVDNNAIATTAPAVSVASGAVAQGAGTQTLTLTAADETIKMTISLLVATNLVTLTSPTAVLYAEAKRDAGVQTITLSNNNVRLALVIPAGPNSIAEPAVEAIVAPVASVAAGGVTRDTDTNLITLSVANAQVGRTLKVNTDPAISQYGNDPINIHGDELINFPGDDPKPRVLNITLSPEFSSGRAQSTNGNQITLSAPVASVALGAATTSAVVSISNPAPQINLIIPAGTNNVAESALETITAPTVSIALQVAITVATNNITSTANASTVATKITVAVDTNLVTTTSPTVRVNLVIPAGTNSITETAPTVTSETRLTIVTATTSITTTAIAPTIATQISVATNTNTITVVSPAAQVNLVIPAGTNNVAETANISISAAAVTSLASTRLDADVANIPITSPQVNTELGLYAVASNITCTASPAVVAPGAFLAGVDTNEITLTASNATGGYGLHVASSELPLLITTPTISSFATVVANSAIANVTAETIAVSQVYPLSNSNHITTTALEITASQTYPLTNAVAIATTVANVALNLQVSVEAETNAIAITTGPQTTNLGQYAGTNDLAITDPTITVSQIVPLTGIQQVSITPNPVFPHQVQRIQGEQKITLVAGIIPRVDQSIVLAAADIFVTNPSFLLSQDVPLTDANLIGLSNPDTFLGRGFIVDANDLAIAANAITVTSTVPVEMNEIALSTPAISVSQMVPVDVTEVVVTAPAITVSQTVPLEESALLTFTTPTVPAVSIVTPVDTSSITLSAPVVPAVSIVTPVASGQIAIAVDTITVSQTIPLTTAAIVTLSAPVVPAVSVLTPVASNNITLVAPAVTVTKTTRAGENTVTLSSPTITVSQIVPLSASNNITIAAPTITVSQVVPIASVSIATIAPAITATQTIPVTTSNIVIAANDLRMFLFVPITTNIVTLSASAITVSSRIPITTATLTATVPSIAAVYTTVTIPVNSGTIGIAANVIAVSQEVPIESVTILLAAPAITVSKTVPITTNLITATAPTVSTEMGLPVAVNTIVNVPGDITASLIIPFETAITTISAVSPTTRVTPRVDKNEITITAPIAKGVRFYRPDANVLTITNPLLIIAEIRIPQTASVITISPITFTAYSTAPFTPNPLEDTWVIPSADRSEWSVPRDSRTWVVRGRRYFIPQR